MTNHEKIYSLYAKFFDSASRYWVDDSETNLTFLKTVQKQMNEQLKEDGYLFLNDVYIALGIRRTKYGQVCGWIYDEDNTFGDNFVDFGIYDKNDKDCIRFVNGEEDVILLSFNVDGNILGRIPDDRLPVV